MAHNGKRPAGHLIGAVVNLALLYAVLVWPGWGVLPFLTEGMQQVLGLVTASLLAGAGAELVLFLHDTSWLRAFGDLVTTGVGLAALAALWQVFPFDFGASSFDWALVVRTLLVLGIVGSAIGLLVAAARLVRLLVVNDVTRSHRLGH